MNSNTYVLTPISIHIETPLFEKVKNPMASPKNTIRMENANKLSCNTLNRQIIIP